LTKIWLDVEDLFQYARLNPRPSGIQRVEYELCRALAQQAIDGAGSISFLRHAPIRNSFHTVSYHDFETLFGDLAGARRGAAAAPSSAPQSAPRPRGKLRRSLKQAVFRLPDRVRGPLLQIYAHQRASLAVLATALRRPAAAPPPSSSSDAGGEADFRIQAAPGDVLAVLGSPWFHPDYAGLAAQAQQRGLRLAVLIYDLIPVMRPEWCDRGLIDLFDAWVGSMLPLADIVLTISQASARDIARYAARRGFALRAAPRVIPMGTGFSTTRKPDQAHRAARLPPPGSYALIVATIEARKNHALLFRVWRRLLDEMPPACVPTLVFAGRVGWLVGDLMTQLRNADFLGGKIVLVEDPSDAELAQLYDGCLFTLFPSLYEGWGLPVTESLGYGRPCLIADATSLPEAGGTLARYFDPDSVTDAANVIRATIEDTEGLAAWRDEVAAMFVPVGWEVSARAVLDALLLQARPRNGDAA
jgi:glycosyltransferase involved in cell wall biosynthesis